MSVQTKVASLITLSDDFTFSDDLLSTGMTKLKGIIGDDYFRYYVRTLSIDVSNKDGYALFEAENHGYMTIDDYRYGKLKIFDSSEVDYNGNFAVDFVDVDSFYLISLETRQKVIFTRDATCKGQSLAYSDYELAEAYYICSMLPYNQLRMQPDFGLVTSVNFGDGQHTPAPQREFTTFVRQFEEKAKEILFRLGYSPDVPT